MPLAAPHILLATLLLAPPAGPAAPPLGTTPGTFARNCAHCHGARLEGERAASLVDGVWLFGGDPTSIAESIREGRPADGMPAFRDVLSADEVRDLVAFIGEKAGEPQRASAGGESGVVPDLALQYDFYEVQDGRVPDGSGRGHTGTIVAGRIVEGRRKPAVRLDGAGAVRTDALGRDLDLVGRALTVGAMCRPSAPDGVIASLRDATDGFSLYLREGVPHFAVWTGGALHEVAGTKPLPLDQWSHVAGVIGPQGGLSLLVNAWTVAEAAGTALARTPAGPFTVGAEAGPAATGGLGPWQGLVEDVRLYLGAVSREAHHELLAEWANRPGCGCHKQYAGDSAGR